MIIEKFNKLIVLSTTFSTGGQEGFYFKLLLFPIGGEYFKNPLQRYSTLRASLTYFGK
jgi:hypothetical protein